MPIDVLRESKVELFLAFQNKELVIDKIGLNRFRSLYKNIKSRYLFKNPERFEDYDLSLLDTFEFYNDGQKDMKKYKAKALYIDEKLVFEPEYMFQKRMNIASSYSFSKRITNKILIYDESLIEDNKVILRSKTGKEEIISIYSKDFYKKAKNKFYEKLNEIKKLKELEVDEIELEDDYDIEFELDNIDLDELTLSDYEDEDVAS